jgi:hypothetical protein
MPTVAPVRSSAPTFFRGYGMTVSRVVGATVRLIFLPLSGAVSTMAMAGQPSLQAQAEFVIVPDISAARMLKVALDGSGQQALAPYRKGTDSYSRLGAGRQLAIYRSATQATDKVTIYDLATAQPRFEQDVPKNTDMSGPVFGQADLYLLRTFTGASDGNRLFVADLRSGSIAHTLASGGPDSTIDALPDGRLYRIHNTSGRISVSGMDGRWADIGQLSIPPRHKIGTWRLNHAGDKIAVYYHWRTSASTQMADIWIADMNGTNQYRLTQQGHMSHPVWSPDDRRVAFKYDTTSTLVGAGLGGGGLTGKCSYWQVPVEASNVSQVSHGRPHAVAREIRIHIGGVPDLPVCTLVAWER